MYTKTGSKESFWNNMGTWMSLSVDYGSYESDLPYFSVGQDRSTVTCSSLGNGLSVVRLSAAYEAAAATAEEEGESGEDPHERDEHCNGREFWDELE